MRGKTDIDLAVDPPPDLVAEIDVTHRSLDREAIYAAMGVPEIWRFDGNRLQSLVLHGA
jgi:Uma2 family endonuclease